MSFTLRSFSSNEDFEACVELQKLTWGQDFSDVVPLSILKIGQKAGGVAAGAFAPDGQMLGFVWGLTGIRDRRPFHWSHMAAVRPGTRDTGIGHALKLYQRKLLLEMGVEEVEWTYDPLESRNANLNLNKLGADVKEYVEDMYAGEMGSELARGIGTDRFIVSWKIASPKVIERVSGHRPDLAATAERFRDAPVIGLEAAEEGAPPLPDAPLLRVAIAEDIQAVKEERPDEAAAWRQSTRRAFVRYLPPHGHYRVEAFLRDPASPLSYYCLVAP